MRFPCLISLLVMPVWSQSPDWYAGVARVSAKDKSPGTGFVVAVRSGRAYIVTCAHVVEGDPKPSVAFRAAPEEPKAASVRHLQGGRMDGLALLVVDRPPVNVRALDAVPNDAVPGSAVAVAGYPVSLGAFSVLPASIVSIKGTELYLAPVTGEGFSGGPVMLNGRVAGVVFGRGEYGRAVPAAIVDVYLRGLEVRWGSDAAAGAGEPAPNAPRINPKDGLTYVWIPSGKFMMGCSPGDTECFDDVKPTREVTIPRGFWMAQTEVTQAAYQRVMGVNPSYFQGTNRPVEGVSWNEASDYCGKVGLRLPTEAEWEYAARAGNPNARYGEIGSIAWDYANSGKQTHEVKQKQPNAWGLYDMLGNVWEWTLDLYANSTDRVVRGGSWSSLNPPGVRVSDRYKYEPSRRGFTIGFRCAGELR